MAMEQGYIEESALRNNGIVVEKWKSLPEAEVNSDDSYSSGFDCNICLDAVHDPVVTLCGHLYCWPCIYKWLSFQKTSTGNHSQCPVCKADVSQDTLVPLFVKGQTAKPSKTRASNLGIIIPRRPMSLACGFDSPRSPIVTTISPRTNDQTSQVNVLRQSPMGSYTSSPILSPGSTAANLFDPVLGVIGEMVYAGGLDNSITNMYGYPNSYQISGRISPRLRRHVMQANRSLSRICFFLFCSAIFCLLLF